MTPWFNGIKKGRGGLSKLGKQDGMLAERGPQGSLRLDGGQSKGFGRRKGGGVKKNKRDSSLARLSPRGVWKERKGGLRRRERGGWSGGPGWS